VKVFYLTPGCFDKGGISRYSRYQARVLRELFGPENVLVFSVLGPGDEDFEHPFEVTYYAGGTSLQQRIAYVAKVYSAAFVHRPDLILSAHLNLAGVGKLLSELTGATSVLNVYGAEVWSVMRRDAAWGLRHTDHLISDCHFTARYLEAQGLRPNDSVAVIWDCVELERFFPGRATLGTLQRYGIPNPDEGINILTLGRMSSDTAYKGYGRLLDVFSHVAHRLENIRLIYAGRGEMVEKLRRQACAMGLGSRVFFTGMVHEDDLADVYRSAHVFSLVTERGERTGEGIPLTPLEAAACGVPLIVGNHDGSQEAVVDGSTGYIIEPFDLDSHAKLIFSLATDVELRLRMGEAARKRAELEFGYADFFQKHKKLLTSWFSCEFGSGLLQQEVTQRVTLNI